MVASSRMALAGVSLIALASAASAQTEQAVQTGASPSASAQAGTGGEIVVTGIRNSLRKSQELKRDSDVVQDSISADDIGALPDRSVTEALQRVPGVSINYFTGGSDTQRYAAEGGNLTIRGLTGYTRSEFNGREAFSVSGGRGLGFEAVPAELLAGVDVVKSTSADRIEGGIAGTVNLRTRLPFDQKGQLIGLSGEMSYGDMRRLLKPTISGLYSNRWSTGIGDVGVLVNAVTSRLSGRSDSLKVESYVCRHGLTTRPDGVDIGATQGTPCFGLLNNANPAVRDGVYVPRGVGQRRNDTDRIRNGGSAALQWKSTDGKILATAQYVRSDFKEKYREHYTETSVDVVASAGDAYPLFGTGVTVGDNGIVTEATLQARTPFAADNTVANPGTTTITIINPDGTRSVFTGAHPGNPASNVRTPLTGLQTENRRNDRINEASTQDFSLNVVWNPTDRLRISADGQRVRSTSSTIDNRTSITGFENVYFKTDGKAVPEILLVPTDNRDAGGNVLPCPSTTGNPPNTITTPCPSVNSAAHPDRLDPHNYYWRDNMDHYDDGEGKSLAFRLDGTYDFDGSLPLLESLAFGGRWTKREQVYKNGAFNFGTLSDVWGGVQPPGAVWLDEPWGFANSPHAGAFRTDLKPSDFYEVVKFDNFFGGGAQDITGGQGRLFPSFNTATDLQSYAALGEAVGQTWRPMVNPYTGSIDPNNRSQCPDGRFVTTNWRPFDQRCGVVPGDKYLANEINPVEEVNKAAYVSARYAVDLMGEMRLTGNVGVRYTTTKRQSSGFDYFTFPGGGHQTDAQCATALATSTARVFTPQFICALPPERRQAIRDFLNGAIVPAEEETTYRYWLPSFNARLVLSRSLQLRFAANKSITPPSFGTVRSGIPITLETPTATTADFQFVSPLFTGSGITASPATGNINNNFSNVTVPAGGQLPPGACVNGSRINGNFNCTQFVPTPIIPASQVGRVSPNTGPDLKPVVSRNLDASIEWYFAPRGKAGSLTLALFHKRLSGLQTTSTQLEPYTNNGQTFNIYVTRRVNSPDKGLIKGFEIAYQHLYDFLPGVLSGFGVNANYTRVHSKGVRQLGGAPVNALDIGAQVNTELLPLVGLSKHNVNFAGFYEKYGISARLAYSWRSDYVLTLRDSARPNSPITQTGNGQLDGSLFYDINKRFKIGVQGVNLTNKLTRTNAVINNDLDETGRSWFVNDRRYTLVLRARY